MSADNWRAWVRNHATNLLRVAIVLLFVLLAVWAISPNHYELVIAHREPWLWLTTALVSVGPELAGIVIGVVTIDYLNERRQREQLKAQLIRQMGMNVRDTAVAAARELAHHGWLYDGSLSGADLGKANLSGAGLERANLSRATLEGANLSKATLEGANLSRAVLERANLSGADLVSADLSGATLSGVNLSGARLWKANLSGAELGKAYMREANLSDAYLSGVKLWAIEQLEEAETLKGAVMPDGVQLGREKTLLWERIVGPTFREWRVQYLAEQEAERAEHEPISELDNTTDGQAESGSPGPI